RHPAEQSDFFRLARLYADGGLYVDADDRRVGLIHKVLDGESRVILCSEPHRAIANNFMAAPPRHPLFKLAATLCKDAMLARDNENIWNKTGPGLITRATARYLVACEQEERAADLRIYTVQELSRIAQFHVRIAYKDSPTYWKASSPRTASPRRAAVSKT
ncbi:glycosyltransferase, partial [Cognatishimia sp. F0-27]|uniref:glycosyltransferase n=1 Tax=Cognatishimia sp. F0-27 TaxID=2816855 RepID=UPI001D0C9322